MAVSRINHGVVTPVGEENLNSVQPNKDQGAQHSSQSSQSSESSQGLTARKAAGPTHLRGARGNLMAQIKRASSGGAVSDPLSKDRIGAEVNKGLVLALDLMHAMYALIQQDGTDSTEIDDARR